MVVIKIHEIISHGVHEIETWGYRNVTMFRLPTYITQNTTKLNIQLHKTLQNTAVNQCGILTTGIVPIQVSTTHKVLSYHIKSLL